MFRKRQTSGGSGCFVTNKRGIILTSRLFLLGEAEVGELVSVLSGGNHTQVVTDLLLLEVLLGEVLLLTATKRTKPSGISSRSRRWQRR